MEGRGPETSGATALPTDELYALVLSPVRSVSPTRLLR